MVQVLVVLVFHNMVHMILVLDNMVHLIFVEMVIVVLVGVVAAVAAAVDLLFVFVVVVGFDDLIVNSDVVVAVSHFDFYHFQNQLYPRILHFEMNFQYHQIFLLLYQ